MTSWSRGDLVVVHGVVDRCDANGDVCVVVEMPEGHALDLPTLTVYRIHGSVLRRAGDGAANAIRERDELRSAVRSIGAAAKIPCVGIVDAAYCERVRDAVRALRSDEATVERDAERDALMAENKKIRRALAAALQLVGECALSDYMDGGER